MPAVSGQQILERIDRLIPCPDVWSPDSPHFVKWRQDCIRTLERVEGKKSSALKAFHELDFEGNSFRFSVDESTVKAHFRSCLEKAQAILQSVRESVLLEMRAIYPPDNTSMSSAKNSKVFVVHGHDEKLKTQVARFLEKLELQPIILHEQPDQGLTIIEKFEKHSNVSFAVVLLTPDDEGRKKSANIFPTLLDDEPELQSRARQNVIFEFGYFLGKLGRSNVCGLYCEGVELPSDYSGVLYTKVDSEGVWQFKLFKELKAAGFAIDANRVT